MSDEITLRLPRGREFHQVAHLVLGGLAMRFDVTVEVLEDLQIALAAVLDRTKSERDVIVSLSARDGILETRVGPVEVTEELEAPAAYELNLQRVLSTVVDEVEVDGEWVRLTKKVA
jgi:hypothetical protein